MSVQCTDYNVLLASYAHLRLLCIIFRRVDLVGAAEGTALYEAEESATTLALVRHSAPATSRLLACAS